MNFVTHAMSRGLKTRGDGTNDHSSASPNHSRIVGVFARMLDELYNAVGKGLACGLFRDVSPRKQRGKALRNAAIGRGGAFINDYNSFVINKLNFLSNS